MTDDPRIQTFETPRPIRLRVDIPRGRIHVVAQETQTTRIELKAINGDATARAWIAEAEITQSGEEVLVRVHKQHRFSWFGIGGGIEATLHVPLASDARLGTGSGHIDTTGRLGAINASSGSGSIKLDESREAEARTGSGDITVGDCAGSVDAKTGSGRITVGKVGADVCIATGSGSAALESAIGDAKLRTGSGNLEIGQAGDSLDAFAASGSVKVRRADHGRVRAKTISGGVSVGVAGGAAALLDISTMSGRVNSELESGGPPAEGEKQVELIISTMSGNVNLARA